MLARAALAITLLTVGSGLHAQCVPAGAPATTAAWAAPLARRVTFDARGMSLRASLDRLSAVAELRLSYAPEYLPLDRRVCEQFVDTPAGDALLALLRGTAMQPVVTGPRQVALAPLTPASTTSMIRPRVEMLERVVVTGTATGGPQRGLAVAVDVLDAPRLATHDEARVDRVLDGSVPGIWAWTQSPTSVLTRYGSIRGAASFGLSAPKIYVDGIEVANPLLITHFGTGTIDHVEVIRGPQSAALYGADAISGVINVVSRHDGVALDGRRAQLRTRGGFAGSTYSSRPVLAQEHALDLRFGSSGRSAGLSMQLGALGDYVANGYSRRLAANGEVRRVGSTTVLAATARLFAQNTGAPDNPLLRGLSGTTPMLADTLSPQAVRQYTVGGTATIDRGGPWTHRIVAGIDGYRLGNLALSSGPIPSLADSALRAARGGADRTTLRASSIARVGVEEALAATITITAEHAALREEADPRVGSPPSQMPVSSPAPTALEPSVTWRRSTGASLQAQLAVQNSLFATAGLRVERSSGFGANTLTHALPMLGAAWVVDGGDATIKLRGAYGRGIRPPRVAVRSTSAMVQYANARSDVGAEEQAGVEGGFDLLVGRGLELHVTRFDQRATGLIHSVAVMSDTGRNARMPSRRVAYELQNVGAITNRGWELKSELRAGPVAVRGSIGLVASRVARVTPGYTGDLRPGDRMLEVPARTMGLELAGGVRGWRASAGVVEVADWIGYDRVRLSRDAVQIQGGARELIGERLREYWLRYDGVTRLRASLERPLRPDVHLLLAGDNLLGQQHGEPDNATLVPGRTVIGGVRLRF